MQLINIIHQENPHIREVQQENKELKKSLEDHQRVLEHIMTKYREHTQKQIYSTNINFKEVYDINKNEVNINFIDILIIILMLHCF